MQLIAITVKIYTHEIGSGFGKKISNWLNREKAYPANVLHLATECGNKNHSAVFPEALPEWFINLFTEEGDLVLDPFLGSGTTTRVSKRMGRNSIGIELLEEYYILAKESVSDVEIKEEKQIPMIIKRLQEA